MTTLRTVIATLKTGMEVVRAVLASLPQVRRLLLGGGGGSVDVIKEAIALLAMCRQVSWVTEYRSHWLKSLPEIRSFSQGCQSLSRSTGLIPHIPLALHHLNPLV